MQWPNEKFTIRTEQQVETKYLSVLVSFFRGGQNSFTENNMSKYRDIYPSFHIII